MARALSLALAALSLAFSAGISASPAPSEEPLNAAARAQELGSLAASAQQCSIASPQRLAAAIGSHMSSALALSLDPRESARAMEAFSTAKAAQKTELDSLAPAELETACLVARRLWSSIDQPARPSSGADYDLFLRLSSDSGSLQATASRCADQGLLSLPNLDQTSASQTAALMALAGKSSQSLERSEAFYLAWSSSFESEISSLAPVSEAVCQAAGEALSMSQLNSRSAEALVLQLRESAKRARRRLGLAL